MLLSADRCCGRCLPYLAGISSVRKLALSRNAVTLSKVVLAISNVILLAYSFCGSIFCNHGNVRSLYSNRVAGRNGKRNMEIITLQFPPHCDMNDTCWEHRSVLKPASMTKYSASSISCCFYIQKSLKGNRWKDQGTPLSARWQVMMPPLFSVLRQGQRDAAEQRGR